MPRLSPVVTLSLKDVCALLYIEGHPEAALTLTKWRGQPLSCSLRRTSGCLRPKLCSKEDVMKCFQTHLITWTSRKGSQASPLWTKPTGGWHLPAQVPCSPTFNPNLVIQNRHFRRWADGPLEDKFQFPTKHGRPSSPSFAQNNYKVVLITHTYSSLANEEREPLMYFGPNRALAHR